MILCVGEILVDMIGGDKNGTFCYERKAGGAPFNVACATKKFGAVSGFVGCVGDDIIGSFLQKFIDEQGLDCAYVQKNEKANTTLAFVELDEKGERSFCFYRKNTADYRLPEIPEEIFAQAKIVHIGSLMLSETEGEAYAIGLAKRAKQAGKIVSFDVNFRDDIFRDTLSAVETYKEIIALADIVKFSEDEIQIFGEAYIQNELKEKLVCVSLGGAGSQWRYQGNSANVPSISVTPVDTTGAGDAFYAGVLAKLANEKPFAWTEDVLYKAFRFGNICGALNTLAKGAIDGLPSLQQIEKYL